MSEQSTLEVLTDWLQHPGTQLFFAHLDQEWGAGGKRFEASVDRFADSREDDPAVLRQLQQIVVCRREIVRLKQWASEEVHRLRALSAPTDLHPRNPLAAALVGQGRRGSL